MKLKNKLDITTEKYWLKNESVAIKGSLIEILDLELYSATKLKDLLSKDIELNEIRLGDYTTGLFTKLKKVLYKSSIEWHTKDLARKKEQLNYISNNHPSELYVLSRHKDNYYGYIKEIWKYRTTEKESFLSKEFLETQSIKSLVEISGKQYISERQSLGESKARWKAHSDKIDSEKNSNSESDTPDLNTIFFNFLLINLVLVIYCSLPEQTKETFAVCSTTNSYVGCNVTLTDPSKRDLGIIHQAQSNAEPNKLKCVERKLPESFIVSCDIDRTDKFITLKNEYITKLRLASDLTNQEFIQMAPQYFSKFDFESREFLNSLIIHDRNFKRRASYTNQFTKMQLIEP